MLGSQRHFLISFFRLKVTKNSNGKESTDLSNYEDQVELANLHLLYKRCEEVGVTSQLTFTYSNSTIETPEKVVKYFQS